MLQCHLISCTFFVKKPTTKSVFVWFTIVILSTAANSSSSVADHCLLPN